VRSAIVSKEHRNYNATLLKKNKGISARDAAREAEMDSAARLEMEEFWKVGSNQTAAAAASLPSFTPAELTQLKATLKLQ
jgi:hypothetical protein